MSPRILLVPSAAKGNGSGHLVRCLALARELGEGASVYAPEAKTSDAWSAAELALAYAREFAGVPLVSALRADHAWDLVVLDRRATSREELAFWARLGPVCAIDEGGEARKAASYLVDVLPRARPLRRTRSGWDAPNLASLGFLDLPAHRRTPPLAFRRVLISFGGEDPAGLAFRLARALVVHGFFRSEALTIVSGALSRDSMPSDLEGVTRLGPVQDLKEHLAQYDLVFTQFGLTAFEAAFAGAGVILFNPSPYHRTLSRRAGFPEIGVLRPKLALLKRYLDNPPETLKKTAAIAPKERRSLASLLASLARASVPRCPCCGRGDRRVVYRDARKSYFRCASCGMLYLERFVSDRDNPYTETYFFEEYRRQYGRSYLEDWPALSAFASSRLNEIDAIARRSLGRSSGLVILDVGCAYGPFLHAARERGHEPYGLDVAEDAVRYVRKELGIPAVRGDFLDAQAAAGFGAPFDVLCMWYVIEHFADLDRALANAAALLRPGGVLALATPSGEGVSARFDRAGFFERSPEDHFTIWEPSRVGGILKAYGFRVEKLKVTGHHPERFPLAARLPGGSKGRFAQAVFGPLSRLCGLGDTFEVYAVREALGAASAGASAVQPARVAPKS